MTLHCGKSIVFYQVEADLVLFVRFLCRLHHHRWLAHHLQKRLHDPILGQARLFDDQGSTRARKVRGDNGAGPSNPSTNLKAGLRYLRLTRLPRHDRGPVPGGNRSAASCLCTVLRRALCHTRRDRLTNVISSKLPKENKHGHDKIWPIRVAGSCADLFLCPSPLPFGGSTVLETYSSTTSRLRPRTRGESIRG